MWFGIGVTFVVTVEIYTIVDPITYVLWLFTMWTVYNVFTLFCMDLESENKHIIIIIIYLSPISHYRSIVLSPTFTWATIYFFESRYQLRNTYCFLANHCMNLNNRDVKWSLIVMWSSGKLRK